MANGNNSIKQAEQENSQLNKNLRQIEKARQTQSSMVVDRSAANLATVRSSTKDNEDEFEAFDALRNSGQTPQEMASTTTAEAVQTLNSDTAEVGKQLMDGSENASEARQTLEATQQTIQENQRLIEDPVGAEKTEAVVHSTPSTTPEEQSEYAFRSAAFKDLSEVMEEMGTLDWATEIGAAFVPGRLTKNLANITGQEFFETLPFSSNETNSAQKILRSAIRKFQEQPLERRKTLWPKLKKDVIDEMGELEGVNMLQKFLSPTGGQDLQEYNEWISGLDAVDLTATAGGLALSLGRTARKYNKIARLNDIGDTPAAGKLNQAALGDDTETVAKVLGIDRTTAANNASPVRAMEEMDAGGTDVGPNTITRLKNVTSNVRDNLRDIMEGERAPMRIGTLQERDYQQSLVKAEEAFTESLKQRGYEVAGMRVDDVDGVSKKLTGYVYRGDEYDPIAQTGRLRAEETTFDIRLADNGTYQGWLGNAQMVNSVKYATRKDHMAQEELLKAASLDNISADQGQELGMVFGRINNLLTGGKRARRQKRERVGDVLVKGDEWQDENGLEVGKVFEPEELRHQFGMSNDEVEYYYGMRTFADELGRAKEHAIHKELKLRGYKNVRAAIGGDEADAIAKPFANKGDAKNSIKLQREPEGEEASMSVLDTNTGSEVRLTNKKIDEVYDKGGQIVRLRDNMKYDGKHYEYLVVSPDTVTDLPRKVMKKKKGYVPRSYENGVYALRHNEKGILNGTPNQVVNQKTLRLFDNESEMLQEKARLEEKMREAGELRPDEELQTIRPGDPRRIDLFGEPVGSSGGLYTGQRGQTPVPFGSDSERAKRTDPIDSIERLMTHVATHYPRNEWRVGMEDRLIKYAEANGITDFDVMQPVAGSSSERKFLERMRQEYLEWGHFGTKEERFWSNKSREMYEWMLNKNIINRESKTGEFVFNIRHKDPITATRAFTFHSLLGFLNPAQVFVQAQAAAVSASLHPTAAPKLLRSQMGLSAAIGTGHKEHLGGKLSKLWGINQKEGEAIIDLYRRTGLDRGVRTTGDLSAAEKGMDTGMAGLSKLADKSLIPYRAGEKFNRRYSFLTSLHEWQQRNPNRKFSTIDDTELQNIYDRARTFMLDMGRANRAQWQKGMLSIPTQFLQVQAKYIEELTNFTGKNRLSSGEKLKVLGGQLSLYGAAGIPFSGEHLSNFLSSATGYSEQELAENEIVRDGINGGFMQAIMHNVFDLEGEFSSRGAVLSGLDQLVSDIFGGTSTPRELLAGPNIVWPERVMENSKQFWDFVRMGTGTGNVDSPAVFWSAAQNLAELTSTGSNLMKVYMMSQTGNLATKYEPQVDEAELTDFIVQAAGFYPSDLSEYYGTTKLLRGRQEAREAVKNRAVKLIHDQVTNPFRNSDEIANSVEVMLNDVSENDLERAKLTEEIYNKFSNPENAQDQAVKDYLESQMDSYSAGLLDAAGVDPLQKHTLEE